MRPSTLDLTTCFVLFAPFIVGGLSAGCGSTKTVAGSCPGIGTDALGNSEPPNSLSPVDNLDASGGTDVSGGTHALSGSDARGSSDVNRSPEAPRNPDALRNPEVTSPADRAPTGTATKYYISDCKAGALAGCKPGDDSNDGTSPDRPWKTFAKALSTINDRTPAGQQYLFARGGSFEHSTTIRISSLSSTKDNPIVFDAYPDDPNDGNRPIITATSAGMTLFNFENGGNAVHDEGYTIRHLDLRGGGKAMWGIYLYNDVDYVTMESLSISGFKLGLYSAGGNTAAAGSNGEEDYFILRKSNIFNNSAAGFLGGGNYFIIEDNTFDNNGTEANLDHNIYVSAHGVAKGGVIRRNTLTHSTMVNGKCSGVSLVVHGHTEGLLIENNTIQEEVGAALPGCYGISVNPGGYGEPEGFPDTIIRGNRVINVGYVGIGVTSCPNCIIENNVIITEQPGSGSAAIMVPLDSHDSDDSKDTGAIIRNNSIFLSAAVGSATGIYVGKEGTGQVVVSNVLRSLTQSKDSDAWTCFDTSGLAPTVFAAFDNNICDFPNTTAGRWERTVGDLQSWRAKGLDAKSYQEDPGFKSPQGPAYDLSISSGSALGNGHPTRSSEKDINGLTRGTAPDMGAYQRPKQH